MANTCHWNKLRKTGGILSSTTRVLGWQYVCVLGWQYVYTVLRCTAYKLENVYLSGQSGGMSLTDSLRAQNKVVLLNYPSEIKLHQKAVSYWPMSSKLPCSLYLFTENCAW